MVTKAEYEQLKKEARFAVIRWRDSGGKVRPWSEIKKELGLGAEEAK